MATGRFARGSAATFFACGNCQFFLPYMLEAFRGVAIDPLRVRDVVRIDPEHLRRFVTGLFFV